MTNPEKAAINENVSWRVEAHKQLRRNPSL